MTFKVVLKLVFSGYRGCYSRMISYSLKHEEPLANLPFSRTVAWEASGESTDIINDAESALSGGIKFNFLAVDEGIFR